MKRKNVYRRLIASETHWFGGQRETPKIFETGTRHHVDPIIASLDHHRHAAPTDETAYTVTVDAKTGEMIVDQPGA